MWPANATEELGEMQFVIICKHFPPEWDEACDPFCSSSPSLPIKAVFLQPIVSWWRQSRRTLEIAQDLYSRQDYARRATRESGGKQGNKWALRWDPVSIEELLFPIPLKIWHFCIFKLFLKNAVKPAGEGGRGDKLCEDFLQTIYQKLATKKIGAVWSHGFPNWMGFFPRPSATKAEMAEWRLRGQRLMTTSLAFPGGFHVSKR